MPASPAASDVSEPGTPTPQTAEEARAANMRRNQAKADELGLGSVAPTSDDLARDRAAAQARGLAATPAGDDIRLRRQLGAQVQRTLASVPKGKSFRLFSEWSQQERAVLGRATFAQRDAFKKAGARLAEASTFADDLRKAKADGVPKCYTIGCQANFEYDIWRYDARDDYTGEGLEKPNGILKPKAFTFEGE